MGLGMYGECAVPEADGVLVGLDELLELARVGAGGEGHVVAELEQLQQLLRRRERPVGEQERVHVHRVCIYYPKNNEEFLEFFKFIK
jgi:hypothetical protein